MDTSPFSIAILHFMEPLMQAENPFSGTDTIFSATMVVDENENALGYCRWIDLLFGLFHQDPLCYGKSSFSSRNIFLLARGESKTEIFHIMIPFSFLQKSKKLAFTLNFLVVFHYI